MRRFLGRTIKGLLLGVAIYAGAALIGALVPVNRGWTQAASGVRVFVVDNGIHTDLALPGGDLADLVRPEHLRDPSRAAASHVLIGWGDREFYLNTPTWAQVSPLRLAAALVGAGSTVLHVSHVAAPVPGAKVRALMLRPDEYARLLGHVRAGFAGGAVVPGYGDEDAFYPARGGYSAFRTCNQWTAEALKTAGVRIGAWTPFAFGVMRWL